MEIILGTLFEIIVEVFFYIIFQNLIAFVFESVISSFKEHKSTNKNIALLGCIVIGSIIGLISFIIYPKRILGEFLIRGISLILSPIITGLIMKKWGDIRTESNKKISILATFWGGALFGFAYALVRYLLIDYL